MKYALIIIAILAGFAFAQDPGHDPAPPVCEDWLALAHTPEGRAELVARLVALRAVIETLPPPPHSRPAPVRQRILMEADALEGLVQQYQQQRQQQAPPQK